MRVVVATPGLPIRGSIAQIYVAQQARSLARSGHQVVLLCLRPNSSLARSQGLVIDEVWGVPALLGEYPVTRGLSYLPLLRVMRKALERVRELMQPEVIHAHLSLPVGFASVMCAGRWRIPVVVTEHTGPTAEMCRTLIARTVARYTLKRAAGVIAVSQFLKNDLRHVLGITRAIDVIPNMYDSERFLPASEPSRSDETPVEILCVGRAGDSRKGNDIVIRAFAEMRRRTERDARLTLVGLGLETELRPLVTNLGIADHVRFCGMVVDQPLVELMQKCHYLVCPSRYETFCIAIIEAMACGKPVVATNCGGPSELVGERCGLLVPVDDVSALAQAMSVLATTYHRYPAARIAERAAGQFGERPVATRLTRFYESVVNGPASER